MNIWLMIWQCLLSFLCVFLYLCLIDTVICVGRCWIFTISLRILLLQRILEGRYLNSSYVVCQWYIILLLCIKLSTLTYDIVVLVRYSYWCPNEFCRVNCQEILLDLFRVIILLHGKGHWIEVCFMIYSLLLWKTCVILVFLNTINYKVCSKLGKYIFNNFIIYQLLKIWDTWGMV